MSATQLVDGATPGECRRRTARPRSPREPRRRRHPPWRHVGHASGGNSTRQDAEAKSIMVFLTPGRWATARASRLQNVRRSLVSNRASLTRSVLAFSSISIWGRDKTDAFPRPLSRVAASLRSSEILSTLTPLVDSRAKSRLL